MDSTLLGLRFWAPRAATIQTAIRSYHGDRRWVVASGSGPRDHPALRGLTLPALGWPLRTFVLVTKSLLFAAQEGPVGEEDSSKGRIEAEHAILDAKPKAYIKETGAEIAALELPANATGSPMTYSVNGRQFIVVAIGGSNLRAELVAFSLP